MSSFSSRPFSLEQQKQLALNITRVLSIYGYITDSYIIEFFTDGLWGTLPQSWQMALNDLPSTQLANLLLETRNTIRSVWPLSLLAFKVTAHTLAFPRAAREDVVAAAPEAGRPEEFRRNRCQSSMLDPLLRRHVRPKKQHEIRRLGELVKKLSDVTGCDRIVDVGSGQGHLSRFLAFGFGLSVTAVEADEHLVAMATKFDQQLGGILRKEKGTASECLDGDSSRSPALRMPRHILGWVDPRASWEEFLLQLCEDRTDQKCPVAVSGLSQLAGTGSTAQQNLAPCSGASAENAEKEAPALSMETSGGEAHGKTAAELSEDESEGSRRLSSSNQENRDQNFYSCPNISRNSGCCQSCGCHRAKPPRPPGPLNSADAHGFSAESRFVLTGLHACGDLSVAMLRHFARCPNIVGITSVACCYMKITTPEPPAPPGGPGPHRLPEPAPAVEPSYPMSAWVAQLPGHRLSYKAREVACHAIEDYAERLRGEGPALHAHCFRAVLETVIRGLDPSKKRLGIQTIKKAYQLSFEEYARRGLARAGLDPGVPLDEAALQSMLSQRRNVVAFFSLALLLAPLVETLLLLDRMIFLQERGFQCELLPLFHPTFSPRNLVLVAAKPSSTTLPADEPGKTKQSDKSRTGACSM
ncbi:protein RRNAD1 isoform X2 [Rhinatrema bivittatum]|uniref:protein RRNAD1 isoform X2 n=1 Tax=Rhinatrema bivittatum TaxID=194408 RepID=UPI0011278010|nr:protein RRNAD1 isoform X2 [Rhinatrema bivittatum]